MTSDEMSAKVAQFFNDANLLQWKKNRDYHPEQIAFLEIMRTACEAQITVEQDLWAKIRKQYVALRRFVIDGQIESELPSSRMTDIAVYMGILSVWIAHHREITLDAFKYVRDRVPCEVNRESGRTCVQEGFADSNSACDRCRFLEWLADHVN